jgi:hypothetical protein
MSRDTSIDIKFRAQLDFEVVLEQLEQSGWTFLRDHHIIYMVNDFDWKTSAAEAMVSVRHEMRISYTFGDSIAISSRLPRGERLANVLFHDDRRLISLIPLIDYQVIPESPRWIDLGWYITQLVVALQEFPIAGIMASDEL